MAPSNGKNDQKKNSYFYFFSRWKMWLNKIRDMGRNFCGLDAWQEGPVSLPAGLSCPNPANPFQRSDSANRIVGGQDVDRATTWPWIVDMNGCGGSIISKNPSGASDWILTGTFKIILI
jgi:hypothetical protein